MSFRNAEDARAYLPDATNVQPDMLLVDVRLPAMSGILSFSPAILQLVL